MTGQGKSSEVLANVQSPKNEDGFMDWVAGDWVVFDLSIGQIKEVRENGSASFSDGMFETSGGLLDRFRPLTLRNKRIIETFDIYYGRLKEIDGNAGFDYPRISSYFSSLALQAIDDENGEEAARNKAMEFIHAARDYKPIIDGVHLFRRAA